MEDLDPSVGAKQFPPTLHTYDFENKVGYEDPFATFSWQHWLDMQAETLQRFARFQRAIERREPKLAILIAVEMQELVVEWQREACEWVQVTT